MERRRPARPLREDDMRHTAPMRAARPAAETAPALWQSVPLDLWGAMLAVIAAGALALAGVI
jgi:hypothetical protein